MKNQENWIKIFRVPLGPDAKTTSKQLRTSVQLRNFLQSKGVETAIHYPIPIHLQPASRYLGYKLGDFQITEMQSNKILSLPINQYLKEKDIKKICRSINKFYEL